MWRCKKCGCTDFIEKYVNGYRKFGEYDKNGDPIFETIEDDDPELRVECENCGNDGSNLKKIAEWEEK